MKAVELSSAFYFELNDGDIIWPSTIAGMFRISHGGEGHNILNEGEFNVSEKEMIDGVLNHGKVSRFRSKTNPARNKANHFSIASSNVVGVYVNVGGVNVRFK